MIGRTRALGQRRVQDVMSGSAQFRTEVCGLPQSKLYLSSLVRARAPGGRAGRGVPGPRMRAVSGAPVEQAWHGHGPLFLSHAAPPRGDSFIRARARRRAGLCMPRASHRARRRGGGGVRVKMRTALHTYDKSVHRAYCTVSQQSGRLRGCSVPQKLRERPA